MPRGSNHQKPYPPEFRREAVALYRSSAHSLKEIASDLGVSSESPRIWVKQSAIDAGKQPGPDERRAAARRDEPCAEQRLTPGGRRGAVW